MGEHESHIWHTLQRNSEPLKEKEIHRHTIHIEKCLIRQRIEKLAKLHNTDVKQHSMR